MNAQNPLVGASILETVQSASDALNGFAILLSDRHNELAMLIEPIRAALELAASQK